jgi:hypothetical protein
VLGCRGREALESLRMMTNEGENLVLGKKSFLKIEYLFEKILDSIRRIVKWV